MAQPDNWHRLSRALRQVDPTNPDGAWQMITSGTINIIGGGSGGTSSVDNNPFTAGGTSITPVGGYQGGRTVASGNTAAFAMNASGMLIVAVGAGGAGGGLAQLQVAGTDNSTFANVGYGSGAGVYAAVPVSGTVNIVGGGGFASVAVYGSPGMPIYNIGTVNVSNVHGVIAGGGSFNVVGSVNVGNAVGVLGVGGSVNVIGSVNVTGVLGAVAAGGSMNVIGSVGVTPLATFTVALDKIPTVNLGLGTINVGNTVGIFGSVTGIATINIASHVDTGNSAVRVNVVAGGAGGGNAQLQVVGTDNSTWRNVGFQSGNQSGFNVVPVIYASGFYATVNVANLAAGNGFASVAVYGSPANPVYVIGSANVVGGGGSLGVTQIGAPWSFVGSVGVTPLATFTVALDKIATVNLGLGTVNIGNAVGIFGSVSVLGSVNLGGVGVVDVRGSLVPTQWIISAAASGQFVVAGSAPANQRIYLSSYQLVATGTVDFAWLSPSGVFLSGSMRLLPGAGFGMAGNFPNGPVLIGTQQSAIYIQSAGTQNIGGVAQGWIAA